MLKFMKADVVGTKEGQELTSINCEDSNSWIPSKTIEVGTGTKKAMSAIEKDDEKKEIILSFRSCLLKTTGYMQKNLQLANPVLRDVQCIHPLVRKTEAGKTAFSRLCMHLTKVTVSDEFCDKAKAEWLLYMCDSDSKLEQWIVDHGNDCSDICSYWDYVTRLTDVGSEQKYKHVGVVVKSVLSLSHGNAAPERGFSVNNSLLSKERLALGEETICATRVLRKLSDCSAQ
jgi:hypothetical protein